MFGIGGAELFIILIFAFLIVGPDKIPEVARTIGKALARFRNAQQEMKDALGGEKIIDLDNPNEPFKDPLEVLDRAAQRQEEKRTAKGSASSKAAGSAFKDKSKSAAQVDTAKASNHTPDAGARIEQNDHTSQGDEAESPRESFSERKARYERERAAQKAARVADDEAASSSAGVGEQ